jgi:ubiquitin carboxyl-terminal hydrolase 16
MSRASLADRNASAIDTEVSVASRLRRRRKPVDRWWRISDEKIKECKTSDVLGMQKEVYLLFYEMEKIPNGLP